MRFAVAGVDVSELGEEYCPGPGREDAGSLWEATGMTKDIIFINTNNKTDLHLIEFVIFIIVQVYYINYL